MTITVHAESILKHKSLYAICKPHLSIHSEVSADKFKTGVVPNNSMHLAGWNVHT